jgi:hypothetical protein
VGSGADGDLGVHTTTNLATDNSGTRTCADGGDAVSYSVTALDVNAATLSVAPSAGCLAPGDEVLVINLQGTASHFDNVGNYETLTVSAIASGSVTFSKPKRHFYGDAVNDDTNLGVARESQRVMLQRVPNYANVQVDQAASLTSGAWDGIKGGVLFFRAAGVVSVAGTVTMSGKGYDGGPNTSVENATGSQGESFTGLGGPLATTSSGAGGGGLGDNNGCESFGTAAGGGGYGSPGSAGSSVCSGVGGGAYGDVTLLTKLMFGSGGGSGGTDNYLGDNPPGGFGGHGGGIVLIAANQLHVTGSVLAAGAAGEGDLDPNACDGSSTTDCWDYSGPGGAGSGGSIRFDAAQASIGADLVSASGGLGGKGSASGVAGDGGVGRIAAHTLNALSGTTLPTANVND